MLTCEKCGHEQEEGKFCGKCGGILVNKSNDQIEATNTKVEHEQQQAQQEVASTTEAAPEKTNESLDKLVDASKNYWSYFVEYLKHPSKIFSKGAQELTNGLISIIIAIILIAFSIYRLFKNVITPYAELSFFSTIFYGFIYMAIAILIVISLLFIISKLFGKDYSFKAIIGIYGAHMNPVVIVALVTLLLALLKANTIGMLLIFVSIGLMSATFPLYLISSSLTKNPKTIDPLYGYAIYVVAIGIGLSIFTTILFDSAFGQLIGELRYFM